MVRLRGVVGKHIQLVERGQRLFLLGVEAAAAGADVVVGRDARHGRYGRSSGVGPPAVGLSAVALVSNVGYKVHGCSIDGSHSQVWHVLWGGKGKRKAKKTTKKNKGEQ